MRAGAMGGLRHHLIGGFGIAEVEKLSRKCATFAPPFIRVLSPQIFGRSGKRKLGCHSACNFERRMTRCGPTSAVRSPPMR
jgi:hypothetical protein